MYILKPPARALAITLSPKLRQGQAPALLGVLSFRCYQAVGASVGIGQILMVPSSDPEAYASPAGEKPRVCTGPWCPLHTSISLPESMPYRWTHISVPAAAKHRLQHNRQPFSFGGKQRNTQPHSPTLRCMHDAQVPHDCPRCTALQVATSGYVSYATGAVIPASCGPPQHLYTRGRRCGTAPTDAGAFTPALAPRKQSQPQQRQHCSCLQAIQRVADAT
jgi:hypothetical protein